MIRILVTLQLLALGFISQLEDRAAPISRRRDERGSVTMEQVLWAVAVIAIVAIVVAAIKAFVTSESAKIN